MNTAISHPFMMQKQKSSSSIRMDDEMFDFQVDFSGDFETPLLCVEPKSLNKILENSASFNLMPYQNIFGFKFTPNTDAAPQDAVCPVDFSSGDFATPLPCVEPKSLIKMLENSTSFNRKLYQNSFGLKSTPNKDDAPHAFCSKKIDDIIKDVKKVERRIKVRETAKRWRQAKNIEKDSLKKQNKFLRERLAINRAHLEVIRNELDVLKSNSLQFESDN